MKSMLNKVLPRRVKAFLRRWALRTIPTMRHLDMELRLRHMQRLGFEPRTILDIGAAAGEWSRMVARIWPEAQILGVEPNNTNTRRLEATKRELPHFDYWQGLLGTETKLVNYVNRDTQTSLLDPTSDTNGTATAQMMPLDALLQLKGWPAPDLLKLDVQGFELEILRCGRQALSASQAVLLEVSFFRFFQGMPLADEVVRFMGEQGFTWYEIMGIYRRRHDDALGQMDLMFVREDHPLRWCSAW